MGIKKRYLHTKYEPSAFRSVKGIRKCYVFELMTDGQIDRRMDNSTAVCPRSIDTGYNNLNVGQMIRFVPDGVEHNV